MSSSKTPMLDRFAELQRTNPMMANVFRSAPANRAAMVREQAALNAAEVRRNDADERTFIKNKPHHAKLRELRQRSSGLADLYENAHLYDLARERGDNNEPPEAA